MLELVVKNGLWFIKDRLIVPAGCRMREHIFCLAHDTLGHFGFFKTYESIKCSYFWLNMHKDLEEGYVPSCMDCQRNKSSTSKPTGPLPTLPVPDERCDSVALASLALCPETAIMIVSLPLPTVLIPTSGLSPLPLTSWLNNLLSCSLTIGTVKMVYPWSLFPTATNCSCPGSGNTLLFSPV